jgi:hypothetical protein
MLRARTKLNNFENNYMVLEEIYILLPGNKWWHIGYW